MHEFHSLAFSAAFYRSDDADDWDRFVAASANGGVLHTRRFLDYHGSRFRDLSLVYRASGSGRIAAILPAVAAPDGTSTAISHAGSSFGGLIVARPDPLATAALFRAASECLLDAGFATLSYLTHPTLFHRQPDDSDQLLLERAGRVVAHHLWSVMRLDQRRLVAKQRSNAARAALRAGLRPEVGETPEAFTAFYDMLSKHLLERHTRKPVHSFDEVMDIQRRLGNSARLHLVRAPNGEPLAATWIWDYGSSVWHSQYICASPLGRRSNALDVLLLHCGELAAQANVRVYSLGRSTLDDGWRINEGLLKYKKRFGCGLCSQRRYEVSLEELTRVCDSWLLHSRW
jgi:hypothetical protein